MSEKKQQLIPQQCARCGGKLDGWTTSLFNTDTICLDCKEDERGAPNYQQAAAAEQERVTVGGHNFQGIGLAPADKEYITARIRARHAKEAR